jgi:hypothetical protein
MALVSMIPKDKQKYNSTEMKYGPTQHLTPAVVKYKIWIKCDPSEA